VPIVELNPKPKTLNLNPKLSTLNRSSYVWTNLACAYSGAGRLNDAARAFRHARELDDSNVQVREMYIDFSLMC
jgi:cytochrome c-type biogenesis protein CcmH/NrfG